MIYVKAIENAIEHMGLANTKVCIHSSIKSFGDEIEGGVKGIIDAFLNKECTIMVPTFSYDYMQNPVEKYTPKRNGINYDTFLIPNCNRSMIFDPDSRNITVENMGVFPKCVLDEPTSKRGNHPINSFTAVGKNAEQLIATQSVENVYAPFQELMNYDGYVLLMGVGLERATIIHYAEELAGRKLFIRWANDKDGNVIPVSGGGCSSGFPIFEPIIKDRKEVMVGNSRWLCYKATDLVKECKQAIIENPQITHCDNSECLSCNDAVLGGPIIEFNS